MLRRLFEKWRWLKSAPAPSASPPPPTYGNLFEMMRYDRGMDVMPYAIGVRPKPPLTDPSGSEPTFVLLDTDAELDAFMTAFDGPITFEQPGIISWKPLLRWNDLPSALMAETLLIAFAYPDDETRDWPFLQLFAIPPDAFSAGKVRPQDTVRGRYDFRQFPPDQKKHYVHELHEARAKVGGVDVFIDGKIPISMVGMLNPRRPGNDQ